MRRVILFLFLINCFLISVSTYGSIQTAECFIDSDPGQGNGIPIVAYDGNYNHAFESVVGSLVLTPGIHTLNIRVKNNQGAWSQVFTTVVTSLELRDVRLIAGEYYIDSDPGQGNGSPMIAYDGNFDQAFEIVSSTIQLSPGLHTLAVRVKDLQGNWSPDFKTNINSITLRQVKLTAAEYFIDSDPGQGSGSPMISFNGAVDRAFASVSGSLVLPVGTHTLNVRVKDLQNQWSRVFTTVVTSLELRDVRLTAGEYYIDSDPGQGNGSPMIAYDGNFDRAFEVVSSTIQLSPGLHTLAVRVKDLQGNWSPDFKTNINSITLRQVKLTAAEYFIDSDPGQGSGSPMISFNGAVDRAFASVSGSLVLPVGTHTLNVRVKDLQNQWSRVFTTVVTSLELRDVRLTAGEYYIDSDPGQGNGSPMIAYDGNFDQAFEVVSSTIQLSPGLHTLAVRVKDLQGNWSPDFKTNINSITLRQVKLTAAEYFIDSDPGQGSGSPMMSFNGAVDRAFASVSGSLVLPVGTHTLNVRVKDLQNQWSRVFTTVVTSLELRDVRLTAGEYYIDSDPGQGNGSPMIAYDGNFDQAFEVVSSTIQLSPGLHTLAVRVKDLQGNWSPDFKTNINSITLRQVKLTAAEYFIDSDPGQGSGSPMISFNGAIDRAFASVSGSLVLPVGTHTLNVRVKDLQNQWSRVFTTVVTSLELRDVRLTAGEYYIDSDPGQGNGSPMIAYDGNFDQAFEVVSSTIQLSPGLHTLAVRVKDLQGNWSPDFKTNINSITLRQVKLTAAEYFIDIDPGQGSGSPIISFNGNMNRAFGSFGSTISLTDGIHVIGVRVKDNGGNWSSPFRLVVNKITIYKTLSVDVFIQGFYKGNGEMQAVISPNSLPNVCDTIVVSIHESVSPYSEVYSATALLSTTGKAYFSYPDYLSGGSYYLALKQRNTLETWSSAPVQFNVDSVSYNFTLSSSAAYGNNLFTLSDGRFAIYSGDITNDLGNSQDGLINNYDLEKIELETSIFSLGYIQSDLNGDGFCESSDFSLIENNLNLGISVAKP